MYYTLLLLCLAAKLPHLLQFHSPPKNKRRPKVIFDFGSGTLVNE